ncbi:hypothetical protein [Planktotalea sp.]|uniref:hypothetical protein n=1 Tax=Planktotalea sp. TaxID=2029877 RepID=UPI0025DBE477|nr:hypothetical protein [Planktotalea sp.]
MQRWLLWTPIMALTAATAVFGLRVGWQVATLTESDVISRAAQDYLSGGQGRSAVDCLAIPASQSAVWITVICTPRGQTPAIYHATRTGKIRLGTLQSAMPETLVPET